MEHVPLLVAFVAIVSPVVSVAITAGVMIQKINTLTEHVKKHNSLIERTYCLEQNARIIARETGVQGLEWVNAE